MSTVASSSISNQQPSPTQKKKSAKEERVNSALRAALFMHEDSQARWEKLIADGAHDNQIWHALLKEFDGGGASQTDDGIQFAYLGGGNGVEPPKFWIDVPSHITYNKPTLKGAKLVHRVRELLQIPAMRPTVIPGVDDNATFDDTDANGDGVPGGSALATSGEDESGSESGAQGHEFKPTTARDGRCSVCNKPRATNEHRAFAAAQRAREQAGKPKREASFWREQASGMTAGIAKKLRPYDTPGCKTLRKIEEYEARIEDGLQDQQWQETLINIADLVDEGNLPLVLFGLTNAYQVRQLMGSGRFDYAPSNMGPTIKTVDDLRAAHNALKPYVPELHDDPNLDPRDGTKWARDLRAKGDDAGSQEAASSGSIIAEADEASSLPEWHQYFEQTPGEGCFLNCGKPEDDPIHRNPAQAAYDGKCPPECGHTEPEHAAFDLGLKDGERGVSDEACPHSDSSLREAWLVGHSVGAANRRGMTAFVLSREALYLVFKNDDGFIVEPKLDPAEGYDEQDQAATIAVARGGAKRVVSSHGLDMPADEILALIGEDERLIAPHDFEPEAEGSEWCKVCASSRQDALHPATEEQLVIMLSLIDVTVDEATVKGWTQEQRDQAEEYAAAVHIAANDHDDVVVPPRPDFLPEPGCHTQDTPAQSSTPVVITAPVADHVTFTKEIEVELSDGDYRRLARDAAFKNLQIEELQAEKDRTVAEYKKKIGGLEEERDEMMRTIRRGRDTLELEVYERRDYDRKIVETVRADIHQVVDSRAMTPRELQQPLPSL